MKKSVLKMLNYTDMNNTEKKVLLVVGGYASTGVGEQFVGQMLSKYDKKKIWRFSITQSVPEILNLYEYTTKVKVFSSITLPVISSFYYWWFKYKYLKNCVDSINSLVLKNNINKVWIILNTPQIIQIGSELASKLNIPLIAQIWDTPEYLSQVEYLDSFTATHLLSKFDTVLNKSESAITISENMRSKYQERYNIDTKTMVFCTSVDINKLPPMSSRNTKVITIIFAGSLYAPQTWNAFLDAVETRNKSADFPKIVVRCIGTVSKWAKQRDWVEYEKLKPLSEVIHIVNKADIAYLPYWMSKKYSNAVKMAFPSKLSLYVSAGTPVFYHGPKDSTPADFMKIYKIGEYCSTMDKIDILNTIDTLLSEKFQCQYPIERNTAYQYVFHPDNCSRIFEKILNQPLSESKSG